jgi:asparagine synthase (glutamine-hydrolysing)
MCGISGIVSKNAKHFFTKIEKMTNSLHHRGPDENGFYVDDNVALGHARLSIVDIYNGKQPIKSTQSKNLIILNGEIYGYKKIRSELEHQYNFSTQTDTEIVLALYEKYEKQMMRHLPGMFAFAIWDHQKKQIFCARDRFGEKPFYYAFGRNGEFIFASEIKAIIASDLIDPVIDCEVAASFLRTMYINPLTTIYKNIFVLPHSHQLIFDVNNKKLSIEKYWQMPPINHKISVDEAKEQFVFLLDQAIKNQMVADVEVSAFLSGGLDSSSVVALASKYNNKLRTISFGFSNKNDVDVKNELEFSSAVAKMYGTNHLSIEDGEINFAELFLKMVEIFDEPFGDSSAIPTYLISKEAAKHSKVVLTGDGADELLAGYSWSYKPILSMQENNSSDNLFNKFRDQILLKIARKKKKILRTLGVNLNNVDIRIASLSYIKNKGLNISQYHAKSRYNTNCNQELNNIGFFDKIFNGNSEKCVNKDFMKTYDFLDLKYPSDKINLDDILRIDINDYMTGDILNKVDRTTMANSLEARAPFLDVNFASFCLSLPYNLKINNEKDKLVMRMAMENKWPENIRNRPKHGFGSPIRKILDDKSFRDIAQQYLFDKSSPIYDLISYEKTTSFIKQNYDNLKEKNPQFLWNLLVLGVFAKIKIFKV